MPITTLRVVIAPLIPGGRAGRRPTARLYPCRHPPRQHYPRAGVVGRRVLRPARRLDPSDSTMRGWNGITYRVTGQPRAMQIDLQVPLEIDSVCRTGGGRVRRDGNAYFVSRSPASARARHDGDGVLSRQAEGRGAAALGRRAHLGARPGRAGMDLDRVPGARRQRLVAHQGHAVRRARQPARGAHRARLAAGRRQRTAPRHRAAAGRAGPPASGS